MRTQDLVPFGPGRTTRLSSRFNLCSVVLGAALAFLACESSVPATNPYDPATDPERQAPSSLAGRLVLRDASAPWDALAAELVTAEVGLANAAGELVRNADGSPLNALLEVIPVEEAADLPEGAAGASFEFVGLKPGTYRLRVDGIGARYIPPGMPDVELIAGTKGHVGDLVFVAVSIDGGGPGTIGGQVRLEGRTGDTRTVELYRMESGEPDLFTQRRTNVEGGFTFSGLPIGTYALRAGLEGFNPDYRLDILVGETGGGMLNHSFTGENSMVLHPVTAVLRPQLQQTEGVYYTREEEITLEVLPFLRENVGGTTRMRLAFNEAFVDEEENQVEFVDHSAAALLSLPDVEGSIEVFAQFETSSSSGFIFVSPIFSTSFVRDATAPVIIDASLPGVARNEDGSFFVTASILNVTLDIDALDEHSAIAGIAVVQPEDNLAPSDVESLVFDNVTSAGGLVRTNKPVPLIAGDGDRHVFVYARDRAKNVSEPFEAVLRVDTQAPALPLLVQNAVGGELRSREVDLAFDETGEDDLPITMQVGVAPLRSSAPLIPYEPSLSFHVANVPHGSVVAFEARLTDAAGNTALARSDSVNLVLLGAIVGRVTVEGVPSLRADHGGVRVRVFAPEASLLDPPLAETTTDSDGYFSLPSVPEGNDLRFVADLPGYSLGEQLIARLAANQNLTLPPMVLRIARGELAGRFQLADMLDYPEGHGGILVRAEIGGLDRVFVMTSMTDTDGTWRMLDVPVTRSGETWNVDGIGTHNYSKGFGGQVEVEEGRVSVVSPDPDDPGTALPVMLHPVAGDFDICAPTGGCLPLMYSNLPELSVQLRNVQDVTDVRVRARVPIDPSDLDDPPFLPFSSTVRPTVDVSGADGQVVVYVQTIVDGSPGPILSSIFVRDTVPPDIVSFEIDPALGAIEPGFTRFGSVRVTLSGDPLEGAIPVAPLANARLAFAEEIPLTPPAGARLCAHGISCEVNIPQSGGQPIEGEHHLYGFACDLAGNCSAVPALVRVIHDRTPPSAVHGVLVEPDAGSVSFSGGRFYTRERDYDVRINLGAALDSLGQEVFGFDDNRMPDVLAYRLAIGDPILQGAPITLVEGALEADGDREVAGPRLPSADGEYRVYAQLIDAAGNRTPIEPNPFFFDLTLDRTPPSVFFTLDGGAQFTASEVVTPTFLYDPLDRPARVQFDTQGGAFAEPIDERPMPLAPGNDTITLPAEAAPAGDGNYMVYARFFDEAGNMLERVASIFLDRTPPHVISVGCASCTTHADHLYSKDPSVLLELWASDNSGTVRRSHLEVLDPGGTPVHSSSPDYSASTQVPLSTAPGRHTITVVFEDPAGNLSAAQTLEVIVDADPPTGTLVLAPDELGNPTTHTRVRNIPVSVNAASDDVVAMSVAQTAITCSTAPYVSYQSSFFVNLEGADGDKTVYVCLKDRAGNTSRISSTITLDTVTPTGSASIGGSSVVNGYTSSRNVTLEISYDADAAFYSYKEGSIDCRSATYQAVSGTGESIALQLSNGDGGKTVAVCLEDEAGNVFQTSASVVLDTTPPMSTIALNGGAQYTTSASVALVIVAPTDAAEMSIHNSGVTPDCVSATYVPFEDERTITLSAGDGLKTIHVCVRDHARNTHLASASIILDSTAPSLTLTLDGGATHTNTAQVTAHLNTSSDVERMAFSTSGVIDCAAVSYEPFTVTRQITLPSVEAVYTVHACVKDAAGNTNSDSASITLDTTPPAVTVTLAGGASRINTTATSFTATVSEQVYWAAGVGQLDCSSQATLYSAALVVSIPETAVMLEDADGLQYVVVCVKDPAGNISSGSDYVTLDREPPSGSVVIAGGADYTTVLGVTLAFSAPSDTSEMSVANGTVLDCATAVYEGYATTKAWTLADLDGLRTVTACFKDTAGNTATGADTILLTREAPGTSLATVTIVGSPSDTLTSETAVTVELSGFAPAVVGGETIEIVQMRVWNSGAAEPTQWTAYQESIFWLLSSGDGLKTVNVRVRDAAGNVSEAVTGSITLDTTAPSGAVSVSGASVFGSYTSSRNVQLDITYDADTAQMAAGEGSLDCLGQGTTFLAAPAGGTSQAFTLSEVDGSKTVIVCFRDSAGNASSAFTSVVLDTAPPVSAVTLAEGAKYTTTTSVSMSIAAPADAAEMFIDVSGTAPDCATATYEAFAASRTVTLPVGDGTKTVHVCVRDHARNTYLASASIILDSAAPPLTLTLNGGDTHTNTAQVTAHLNTSSDVERMAFSTSGVIDCAAVSYEPFTVTRQITLPSVEAVYTVHACVKDAAGNTNSDSASITLDMIAPQVSVTVAGGSSPINTTSTTFSAIFTEEVQWAAAVGSLDCSSTSYSAGYVSSLPSESITLSSVDGLQYVVVCARDRAGNLGSGSDSVELDTTPPTVTILPEGFSILEALYVDDSYYVNNRNITLKLGATGATTVRYAENDSCTAGDEPYSATKPLVLASGDGFKTISVQYLDDAGNSTACYSLIIVLDTVIVAPNVSLMGHDDRSGTTAVQGVTVTLTGVDTEDAVEMRVSNTSNLSGSLWQPLQTSFDWFLPSGDGTKTVFVEIRDRADNRATGDGSIILDQTPPDPPALTLTDLTGDGYSVDAESVGLRWTAPSGTSTYQLQRYRFGTDLDFDTIAHPLPFSTTTFLDEDGIKPGAPHQYRIRAYDSVGNVSGWSLVVVARPYLAIDESAWISEDGLYRFLFAPQTGVFQLDSEYGWINPENADFLSVLGTNITRWLRPLISDIRLNEYVVIRQRNSDNSLLYDSKVPLPLNRYEEIGAISTIRRFGAVVLPDQMNPLIYFATSEAETIRQVSFSDEGELVSENLGTGNADNMKAALDPLGNPLVAYRHSSTGDLMVASRVVLSDSFEHSISNGNWSSRSGTLAVTEEARGEPFGRSSLRLHGTLSYIDSLTSADFGGAEYRYFLQAGGPNNGNAALTSSDILRFEYHDGTTWTLVNQHHGTDINDTEFLEFTGTIPANAQRISFYVSAGSTARFFLDGVEIKRPGWNIQTAHSGTNIGLRQRTVVDGDGIPHIFHYDSTNDRLLWTRRVSGAWSTGVISSTTSSGSSWFALDALVDPEGHLHLAYYDRSGAKVVYATNESGSWTFQDIESHASNFPGLNGISIAQDRNRSLHIAYTGQNTWNGVRWVYGTRDNWSAPAQISTTEVYPYHKDIEMVADEYPRILFKARSVLDPVLLTYDGSDWTETNLFVPGNAGYGLGLAQDRLGNAHITFGDASKAQQVYMKFNEDTTPHWTYGESTSATTWHGNGVAVAVDRFGERHFLYSRGGSAPIYVAPDGSTSIVGSAGSTGFALAVDEDGFAHASIYANSSLNYATNTTGSWVVTVIDQSVANTGALSSIALDRAGVAHISYYNSTNARAMYINTSTLAPTVVSAARYARTSIATDNNGVAHMTYGRNSSFGYANNSNDTMTQQILPGTSLGPTLHTSISVDSQDRVHALAHKHLNSGLVYAVLDGGEWHEEVIETTGEFGKPASLVLDSQDRPFAFYRHPGNGTIQLAVRQDDETWLTSTLLSACGGVDVNGLSAVVDRWDIMTAACHRPEGGIKWVTGRFFGRIVGIESSLPKPF